ncbi:sigma-54-dependent Fis family transcriptional regulator [Mucilaginibacter gossypii]|uniref:Transcriptional regulator containing GAF, AAA-type ATPase, and DNA-binding Fis domains n=1 Tax=Mucilaginibacter gossypii TaxID=551996 RepID=A0A1G8AA78_9SPHI|nr:sigma 54-interacting transcriptional regulator [Mucilaginibacter gossypii]SDH17763.1 Transcriptional regulator containing GAF, AAA-type ATPase, and DNA-binding Fis domains [Mucilaginibacter gossypii]
MESEDDRDEILLLLKRALAKVKTQAQLMITIDNILKKLVNFSQATLLSCQEDEGTYRIFFMDRASGGSTGYSSYNESISRSYSFCDNLSELVSNADTARIYDIRTFNLTTAPQWVKLNYASGARELLIKNLPGPGDSKHTLILFADKLNSLTDAHVQYVEMIAVQLGEAINNIAVHEAALYRERDKASLLKFAIDLASVRKKEDLEAAIFNILDQLMGIKLSMIRLIDDDRITLVPYLYDKNAVFKDDELFKKLLAQNITIDEPTSARVLNSDEPVVFNIEAEQKNGNSSPYIMLWKKAGKKQMYGARLRIGNENIGTLWLLVNELNTELMRGLCSQISVAIFNIKANQKLLVYQKQLETENDLLKEQINTAYNFSEIIGSGPRMKKVYELMSRVADSNSTVLILGETGTGKELIARGIHNASPRKNKLMIKVNCAALPPNLIESELFGHEKGSFTGAFEQRTGKFELANNSTLFLDEIGELPLELQVKLLRVLQEREFERVGGKNTIKVNVRIIAATNRNLENEVATGKFRSDLYYRLNVFPINLPSLRERAEDIPTLANFFLNKYCGLSGCKVSSIAPKVLQQLKSYLWPGNVRELEHIIERSILMASGNILREVHLPNTKQNDTQAIPNFNQTIEEMERSHIINILKQCGGKISGTGGAAGVLAIQPTTLHSKMRKLNITKREYLNYTQ